MRSMSMERDRDFVAHGERCHGCFFDHFDGLPLRGDQQQDEHQRSGYGADDAGDHRCAKEAEPESGQPLPIARLLLARGGLLKECLFFAVF